MTTPDNNPGTSQLFADLVVADFLGTIEIDGFKGISSLDATALKASSPDTDAKAKRYELIEASRGGKHIELSVTAQTFAQTKKPNRRYLRLGEDELEAQAPTWRGQPYLVDHNTWSIKSSMGTITASKAVPITGGMAFEQKLHAVKSDAVIGILDGTFNKFSIGWWPGEKILCSAHGCDVMASDSCACWPGDKVKLEGGREVVVEFVFVGKYRGKETSTVVIPAVQDTHVDEVRAALAAELHIQRPVRTRIAIPKEKKMRFPRLAVALGLAALSEEDGSEDRALAAVTALQSGRQTAEAQLAQVRGQLAQAEAAVQTLTSAQLGVQIDAILNKDGYAAGKLRRLRDEDGKLTASKREIRLRRIAKEDGLEAMRAELKEMEVVVPVAKRSQADDAAEPEREELGAGDDGLNETNPYLLNAAEQTGQDVKALVAFAKNHTQGVR